MAAVLPSHNRHPTIPRQRARAASSSATSVNNAKAVSNAKAISSSAIPASATTVTTDDAVAISVDAADSASRTDHAEVAAGQEQSRHHAHQSRR